MSHAHADQPWSLQAHCRDRGDDMFGETQDQKRARLVCNGCPVRAECLAEALTHRIEWGVWGGMTERERRHLLRQRPDISDWREVLLNAPTIDRTHLVNRVQHPAQ
ncbi:WhiB family transcriptional regulator [Aestuariimicrobium ganziense]|uniref:WhiB family transcriptional regulator n=1 Tax=Aestuariimicrobium ganziense TaxID=2773677 RepID=UPI0019426457|nr:WhiB family transcriptional regulator [Aestuariimicrobium ganziense]